MNNTNAFEKLKENYVSYKTFNPTAGEEKQLMPLFEHILTALDGHRNKLVTTIARCQGPSYSKPWVKEELGRVAAESREDAKTGLRTAEDESRDLQNSSCNHFETRSGVHRYRAEYPKNE